MACGHAACNLLCISGIFCQKSKANIRKERGDAIEGVLWDIIYVMIIITKKVIDKYEHLFYFINRTNVLVKRRNYLWKRMKN